MRAYDIAVAAVALDVDRRWLDNLTVQHDVPGVERFARGVARRLSMRALLAAAIVRDLQRELGVAAPRAIDLARRLLAPADEASDPRLPPVAEPVAELVASPAVSVRVDLAALERDLERRLVHAMETVVPRRRGRPPRQTRRGTR